jgi:hypothetical protein
LVSPFLFVKTTRGGFVATTSDAEVILRLYELRQEETLRRARRFMVFDFNPTNLEELRAVSRDVKADENPYWRQAMSYWEMAHSLVLRGAVDPELFFDSNGEGILLYAKFHHFHAETEKESGNPFMRQTAAMIAKFPQAQQLHEMFLKSFGPKAKS